MNNDLHIERLWLDNSLRNYNYIAVCLPAGEAIVIDPFAVEQILETINKNNWRVKAVINTHDHGDHIAGNDAVVDATGAPLLAPNGASISGVDQWLQAGDEVKLGETIHFTVLGTPGHTLTHISLLSNTEPPELLCGDTIFNAGAGNVHSGDAAILFDTFENVLAHLPDKTRIYPGHDYLQTNLGFTLNLEPDNAAAKKMLDRANLLTPEQQGITTLEEEKQINTFLRLEEPGLVERLKARFPELGNQPTRKQIFLKLRQLRNNW